MSSKFTALPLTSGEAFLLETHANGRDWVILVDSGKKYGKKSRELANILKKNAPNIEHVDIAVCTHQDADHANGFRHFADEWASLGGSIGEYWLPGRWANAVSGLLTDPSLFSHRVWDGAMQAVTAIENGGQVDRLLADRMERTISEETIRSLAKEIGTNNDLAQQAISEPNDGNQEHNHEDREHRLARSLGIEENIMHHARAEMEETDDVFPNFPLPIFPMNSHGLISHPYSRRLNIQARIQFNHAIDTAKSIRLIMESAIKHSIPIRWFDFDLFEKTGKASGGILGVLEPICSVELKGPPVEEVSNLALFFSLRLSRQNVESLVFYRPESPSEPGALFLGDSRLAHGINRPSGDFPISFPSPKRRIIVTAPHHGSRVNDHAYSVVENWVKNEGTDLIYIRNGGQTGQTLKKYLLQSERRCAQCVQCFGKKWNQNVQIPASNMDWQWPPTSVATCGTPRNRP